MAYVPDPTDVNAPIGSTKVGTADEEFRALKAYIKGLVLGAVSSGPSVRQTALIGSQDTNGDPNFLVAGVGLALNLSALSAPLALSYAAGSVAAGDLNYNEAIGADAIGVVAGLQPSNLNYVTKIFNGAWGSTLAPCQYGKFFDKTAQMLFRWPGINLGVVTTEDFGNAVTFNGNAKLSTAVQILGLNTLACDGTTDWASVPFTNLGSGSWEIFGSFRTASLAAQQMLVSAVNAGNFGYSLAITVAGKLQQFASGDGTSTNIDAGTLGTATIAINTTYFYRCVFDAVAGTYRVYLSNNGAAETQEISVASTARICAVTTFAIGAAGTGILSVNGNVGFTGFRRFASFTAAQATGPLVAPTFASVATDFFNVGQMKMYQVTAESTVTGTNPAMIAINKLHLAEAATGAAAVASVISYAYKRQYLGAAQIIPAGGTPVAITHNLGIPSEFISVSVDLVNITTEAGYIPGETLNISSNVDNATQVLTTSKLPKTASVNGTYASIGLAIKTTGVRFAITGSRWKLLMSAKGTF